MTTLNEHFKQLNFCRANKSSETAQQFVAETKAMFRLFEKRPELLTAEVFGLLEHHAKTGPIVKGLDMTQPRKKRFPTDTMCQAAIDLLGNIAVHIPDRRKDVISVFEKIISQSKDYTARYEALMALDALVLFPDGKPDYVTVDMIARQSNRNDNPYIRRDACAFLHAQRKTNVAIDTKVTSALEKASEDAHPIPRTQAISLLTSRARTISELDHLMWHFRLAAGKATDSAQKEQLTQASSTVIAAIEKKQLALSRERFEEIFEKLQQFYPVTPPGRDMECYEALKAITLVIQSATPPALDKLQAQTLLTIGAFDNPDVNYWQKKSCEQAGDLAANIFRTAGDTAAAFDRIERTMRENAEDARIQSGGLKFLMKKINLAPFPASLLETVERCANESVEESVRNAALELLKSQASKTKPPSPGQG